MNNMTKDQLPLTEVLNSKQFKETGLRIWAFCDFIESKIPPPAQCKSVTFILKMEMRVFDPAQWVTN